MKVIRNTEFIEIIPKTYDEKDLKKMGKATGRTLINNYDTDYTGNTKTTIRKYIQGEI